jgi:hypothetical protein
MEIEQGKTDILVGDDMELPKIVKSLLEAATAGELDAQIKVVVETGAAKIQVAVLVAECCICGS